MASDGIDDLTKAVELLLQITRDEIADSNPQQALVALLHAVRLTRGEGAIIEVLDMAKAQARREVEQQGMQERLQDAQRMCELLVQSETLLSERGEQEILKDAFEDGSSVICTKCGALVARVRWESHRDYWCSALPADDGGEGMDVDV